MKVYALLTGFLFFCFFHFFVVDFAPNVHKSCNEKLSLKLLTS